MQRRIIRIGGATLLAGALLLTLGVGSLRAQAEIDPDAKPALDPFVVLIEKKKPRRPARRPVVQRPTAPTRPRHPPLVVKIQTIIGAGDENLAVIEYKNNEYIVGKGWPEGADEPGFDKRFKVVEVNSDSLTVYDQLAKQRKTVRMSDDSFEGDISLGG